MININRNPSRRDLLVFGAGLAVVFGMIGALRWHANAPAAAKAWWMGGFALTLVYFMMPGWRRRLYLAWMYATYPIVWIVSHLLLAAAYFLVATPIAITLRLFGRDPLLREFDRSAASYWIERTPSRDDEHYFRQF
jgi:Saxitoxin biosynthesis operon protein SxtJ